MAVGFITQSCSQGNGRETKVLMHATTIMGRKSKGKEVRMSINKCQERPTFERKMRKRKTLL